MAEQVDRDAAGKIEVTGAVLVDQVTVIAFDRANIATGIDGHQCGDRHGNSRKLGGNDKWRLREGAAI